MKILITIIALIFAATASAQTPVLKKLWVGAGLNYLRGDNAGILRFENNAHNPHFTLSAFHYMLKGDTLHLNSGSNENYTFLIDTVKKGRLILTALDADTKRYFNSFSTTIDLDQWTYKEIQQCYTDSIKFEKVIFKTVGGYHAAPAMIYELEKDGQIRIFGEKDKRDFITSSLPTKNMEAVADKTLSPGDRIVGYYIGQLPKQQLKALIEILKLAEIDKMPAKGDRNIDITDHSMELHYNNKVKYFYGGFTSFATEALMAYLSKLPYTLPLIPSKTKFDIKFSNGFSE